LVALVACVTMLLIAILATVVISEWVTAQVRKKLI
jgi:ABC-type phosphate/phosphonate transport system permease subunit